MEIIGEQTIRLHKPALRAIPDPIQQGAATS